MHRLFIAIDLPTALRQRLHQLCYGLPKARWTPPEQFHLTLRFIGELEGSRVEDVAQALGTVIAPGFPMRLTGAGHFPPRGKPTSIWTGVDGGEPLITLKRRVDNALQEAGVRADERHYMPHITLARLKETPAKRVAAYMQQHAAFTSETFTVDHFQLYESHFSQRGVNHQLLKTYLLADP